MLVYEAKHQRSRLGNDRVTLHRKLYMIMNFPDAHERNWIWTESENNVLVRSERLRDGFTAVHYPENGLVGFQFDAAPKRGRAGSVGRRSRRPVEASEMHRWATLKLFESGIVAHEIEIMQFIANISSFNERNHETCGKLLAAIISGEGDIVNPAAFNAALINGVQGAGPKCWGFGTPVVTA